MKSIMIRNIHFFFIQIPQISKFNIAIVFKDIKIVSSETNVEIADC